MPAADDRPVLLELRVSTPDAQVAQALAVEAICARVGAEHPYETPEILAVPVVAAAEPYAAWLADAVTEG